MTVTGNDLKKIFLRLQKRGKVTTIDDFARRLGYTNRQTLYYYINGDRRLGYKIEDKVNAFMKEVK
jgi:hypothetical protein